MNKPRQPKGVCARCGKLIWTRHYVHGIDGLEHPGCGAAYDEGRKTRGNCIACDRPVHAGPCVDKEPADAAGEGRGIPSWQE